MQSLLRSLNHNSRSIEDLALYASVLYVLRKVEYFDIIQMDSGVTAVTPEVKEGRDPTKNEEKERDPNERAWWKKSTIAVTMLRAKLATTTNIKHFVPDRTLVFSLCKQVGGVRITAAGKNGVYWTVMCESRTLKPNEINYGLGENEVLAHLKVLDV